MPRGHTPCPPPPAPHPSLCPPASLPTPEAESPTSLPRSWHLPWARPAREPPAGPGRGARALSQRLPAAKAHARLPPPALVLARPGGPGAGRWGTDGVAPAKASRDPSVSPPPRPRLASAGREGPPGPTAARRREVLAHQMWFPSSPGLKTPAHMSLWPPARAQGGQDTHHLLSFSSGYGHQPPIQPLRLSFPRWNQS